MSNTYREGKKIENFAAADMETNDEIPNNDQIESCASPTIDNNVGSDTSEINFLEGDMSLMSTSGGEEKHIGKFLTIDMELVETNFNDRKESRIENSTTVESPIVSDTSETKSVESNDTAVAAQNATKRIILTFFLISLLIFVVVDSHTTCVLALSIKAFLEWIESNPGIGLFGFIAVYILCTILFIPASLMTVGAGFVCSSIFGLGLGVLLGSLVVFLGASIGAILAFLIGRYLLRDCVEGLSKKYAIFEALDVALEEKGFRIMLLLRLSPIIPFNVIDYLASVTAVSLKHYTQALVGIIPGVILYVFLGASAGSLTGVEQNMTLSIIVIIVGVVFGVAAVGVTSYYAKKELNRVIAARQVVGEEEEEYEC